MNNYQLHTDILRLLFKYDLVPKTLKEEQEFMHELVELLKL